MRAWLAVGVGGGDPVALGRLRARYRDPSGRERAKSFARKIDAERFLVAVEDAKLRGAYVDPAAGRVPFAEWPSAGTTPRLPCATPAGRC